MQSCSNLFNMTRITVASRNGRVINVCGCFNITTVNKNEIRQGRRDIRANISCVIKTVCWETSNESLQQSYCC